MNDGQEQAQAMWQGLVDAQRQAWSQWLELAAAGTRGAAGVPPAAPASAAPGWNDLPSAWLDPWRQLTRQTTAAWTAGADPVAQDMAQAMAAAQETMLRMGGMMQQAWTMFSAPGAGSDDWSSRVEGFNRQLQQSMAAPWGPFTAMPSGGADLWRSYLTALERLPGPWAELLKHVPAAAKGAFGGDSSELLGQTRMLWDTWERSAGRLFETPSMGYSREFTEMLQRGFEAWVDYRRAVSEYGVVLNEAWAAAGQSAGEMLRARGESNQPITSLREFVNAWSEATDGALETAFRSDHYAAKQAEMLNAAMRYRLRERELVETFLKMTDIPARSELDDAFRRLHALKREVRELQRSVAELRRAGAPAGPTDPTAAAAATAPKSSAGGSSHGTTARVTKPKAARGPAATTKEARK